MKIKAENSFWEAYSKLDERTKRAARKAFLIWKDDPFHPSLRFKCVVEKHGVWAVRITRRHRALGVWDKEEFTWFWIGDHDEYERIIKSLF